jgi:aldehyde:ferredoxin oxidoreductase
MSRKDEKPPEDHWRRRFPEHEEKLLSTYYEYKGWNRDGVPKRETLLELGLGDVAEDLEKRGILSNGQDTEDDQDDQD